MCAAWGPNADWVRNLRAGPAISAQVGTESFTPEHRFLDADEAFEVVMSFRHNHPGRLRLFSLLLGWGNLNDDTVLRRFVSTHPLIALRPARPRNGSSPTEGRS